MSCQVPVTISEFGLPFINENSSSNSKFNLKMLAHSIFTFCYSIVVAMAAILDTFNAYELVFREFGLLIMMYSVINIVIQLALLYFSSFSYCARRIILVLY